MAGYASCFSPVFTLAATWAIMMREVPVGPAEPVTEAGPAV